MKPKFSLKRVFSLLAALALTAVLLPLPAQRAAAAPALAVGDYIKLGRYFGSDLVWRYVVNDDNGALMLAHQIITLKALDATGLAPANTSAPDGHPIPAEPDWHGARAANGSNLWVNSTLRTWLNSADNTVAYVGPAPFAGNVTANPYDQEAGFLAPGNFTDEERAAMKPVTQRSLLNWIDQDMREGGTAPPDDGSGANHENAFYHMITDRVFLPDVLQANALMNSGLELAMSQWWSVPYHRGTISQEAIDQAATKPGVSAGAEYGWWLRTPGAREGNVSDSRAILAGGGLSHQRVNDGLFGVRPAFYLADGVTITGGSGTLDDPYTIGNIGVTLTGNNTDKLYTPETDPLSAAISGKDAISSVSYILINPDDARTVTTESAFAALGAATIIPANERPGGKFTVPIDRNCTVWVMAKGTVNGQPATSFASLTYRNFYDPIPARQNGWTEDSAPLYRNARLPYGSDGSYSIPINHFTGAVLTNPKDGYETVTIRGLLSEMGSPLAAYWEPAGVSYDIALDSLANASSLNPVTVTYGKKDSAWWNTTHLEFVDDADNLIGVTDTENPLVLTNWAPKIGKLSDAGVRYTVPKAVDTNYTAYKWAVYASDGTTLLSQYEEIPEIGDYTGFDPIIPQDDCVVRIYYKSGQVMVTEEFLLDGTDDEVLDPNHISLPNGETYKKNAAPALPAYGRYVCVGYQIGTSPRVNLDYAAAAWDAPLAWQPIAHTLAADVTVRYFFAPDDNDDGIPDGEQVRITARRIGVYPDGGETLLASSSAQVRKGTSYSVTTAATLPAVFPDTGAWLFDAVRGDQTITGTYSANTTIRFYYHYDSTGAGVPDAEQFVTEQYLVFDGTNYTPMPATANTTTPRLIGETYSKTAPYKSGYLTYGYQIDGGPIVVFAGGARTVTFTATAHNHTVAFIYRTAATPVTLIWHGTTLAGTTMEFGRTTLTGYAGEVIAPNEALYRPDPLVWEPGSSDVPASVTLSTAPQTYYYRYNEIPAAVTYDIHFISLDGLADFSYQVTKQSNDPAFDVPAWDIPGYAYSYYILTEFGAEYARGNDNPVRLDPAKGAMSLAFYYAPTLTSVAVRAVEEGTGALLWQERFPDAIIGSEYSAAAPHMDGYALSDGEPLLKTIEVTGDRRLDVITFTYKKVAYNAVIIECLEKTAQGNTLLRAVPVTAEGPVSPPDLTRDYFLFDWNDTDNDPVPTAITAEDFTAGRTIRYYYVSELMDVRIVAMDKNNNPLNEWSYTAAARKGENYTAAAPVIPGYTLKGPSIKTVYANPQSQLPYLLVTFSYHETPTGEVTVRHFYMDGGTKTDLLVLTSQPLAGSDFTAWSTQFDGFALKAGELPSKTITVAPSGNLIEFEYTDMRKTVTVELYKNGMQDGTLAQTFNVPANTAGYRIHPPHLTGYALYSYQIDGGAEMTAGLTDIIVDVANANVAVKLNYKSYVTITIVGKQNNTDGQEFYRYTKRVQFNDASGKVIDDSEVLDIPQWALKSGETAKQSFVPNANKTVEFFYESALVPVTVKAQLENTNPVPNFTPITTQVVAGDPFSARAPYIAGYNLVGSAVQHIDAVAIGTADSLTFTYKQAAGNLTILLKENDSGGAIIETQSQTLMANTPTLIAPPDLTGDHYTALSESKTVTYTNTPLTIEFYYEKDTVQVVKKTYELAAPGDFVSATELTATDAGEYRIGEVASFYAPSRADYILVDSSPKLTLVEQSSGSARATTYHEVPFYYVSTAVITDRLTVEAVDEHGDIIYTNTLTAPEGTGFTVKAPTVVGYHLKPGESKSKTGTVPGKVTFQFVSDMPTTAALTVLVTTADNGATRPGAQVVVTPGTGAPQTHTTDGAGAVTLPGLPLGAYTVRASYTGYHDGVMNVTLNTDQTVQIALGKTDQVIVDGGTGGGGTPAPLPTPEPGDEVHVHTAYLTGYLDGTMRPDAPITRSEAAAMLRRVAQEAGLDLTPVSLDALAFSDIAPDAWYAQAVADLTDAGVFKGYVDGTFRPAQPISRAEFSAIATRFARLELGGTAPFTDVGATHWASAYIGSAYLRGWVTGYPGGSFLPENDITRAEAVVILNRILGRRAARAAFPEAYETLFRDLPADYWAFPDVIEAAVSHSSVFSDRGYESWVEAP